MSTDTDLPDFAAQDDDAYEPDEETTEDVEPDAWTGAAPATPDKKRAASRASTAPDRGLVRRIAVKHQALTEATPDEREMLASLLGSGSSDPVDLTVSVFTSGRQAAVPVSDLLAVAFDKDGARRDPFDAMEVVSGLREDRLKSVWGLAASLGLVPKSAPQSDVKAASSLARGAARLTDAQRAVLDSVSALARRTA